MSPPLTVARWIVAVLPVAMLLGLVTWGRVKARTAALLVAGLTTVLAWSVFGAGPVVLGVGVAKGLWLGGWILVVVWPAMLLYRIADHAGLQRIGALVATLFPNRCENLLILAWLLPSFVQGVAGFGTPIAVAAPLLLASGWSRTRAVAYPLIGYHWSVTFGSMGSSFYMAALTAHLDSHDTDVFARHAALLLGVNCLVAGALILLLDGGLSGLRQGARLLLLAGVPMAATLYLAAPVVPAVATVAAGAVGFAVALTVTGLHRWRAGAVSRHCGKVAESGHRTEPPSRNCGGREDGASSRLVSVRSRDTPGVVRAAVEVEPARDRTAGRAGWLVTPYLYLLVSALAVLLVPSSRRWVSSHLVLGPAFPGTTTQLGWHNDAVDAYTPLAVLAHPGAYITVACLLGYVTYRRAGLWEPVPVVSFVGGWLSSVRSTSISILGLATTTTILVDTGMISTLARGAVRVTGSAFPLLSGLTGALGSFLTGSTTSSNAMFAALQAQAAGLLHLPSPVLLAAQTAGSNVGNSLSPVIILIGLSAVGAPHEVSTVLRPVALAAVVLLATVTATTALMVVW
ncbi:MAG: L-lactate permease [Nocardioidaceae bacterium]